MPDCARIGLALALAALSGGCATTPADCAPSNRDASLIAKASCEFSGTYDARTQALEKTLLDEQKMNSLFRDVYASIEKEKGEVRSELAKRKTDYTALNRSLNALLSELQQKSKGNARVDAEIAKIRNDLHNVEQGNDPVVMKKQVQLDQLKNRVAQLEESLGLRKP